MKRPEHKQPEVPVHALDINQFARLKDLFNRHGWPIEEDSDISVYKKYYKTLLTLEKDQQDFLITLSDRLLHITIGDYLDNLINPLTELRNDSGNDNLIFIPCLPEEDAGKIKSATTVLYQLKGSSIKSKVNIAPSFVPENITADTFSPLEKLSNYQIVLVDDFIGTGETAVGAVSYLLKLAPFIPKERIKVLSIVAMEKGINELKNIDIKTYCNYVLNKAISDFYKDKELANAIQMMEGIETRIKKLKPEFHFGYKQSEALVCMERCPNNTFPIYWKTANVSPYER